jgi:hypothetical protein
MDQEAGYDRKCKSLGALDQNTDTTDWSVQMWGVDW